jgi:hypothetical protein
MFRYERFMIWEIQYGRTRNRKILLSRHLFQRVSGQGKQTIPYLLMTTLRITFYKNIKSVHVLVNHHFLILGGTKKRGGGEFNVWTEFFFTTNHKFFSQRHWWLWRWMLWFPDEFFNFEQILRMSRDNWIPKNLFLK